ncbi:Non-specific serine/threonine protein kinase [Acanthopleuribacter pedis]
MLSIRNMIDQGLPEDETGGAGAAAVLDQIRDMLEPESLAAAPSMNAAADPFDAALESGLPVLSELVDLDWGWQAPAFFGRFKTGPMLGVGGTASVFLGVCPKTERRVAVKMLHSRDPRLRQRFLRERRILSSLAHPNLTSVIESGFSDCGFPWFAMDYIEGRPLDHWSDGCELTLRDRVRLFLEVCEAVTYAHGNHVIHRDIKPANILVERNGRVRLLDFGIASILDPDSGAQPTVSRLGLMTPEYASPEQLAGRPLSAATDIYSLGVVLFELLVGDRPRYRKTATRRRRRRPMSLQAQFLANEDPARIALLRRRWPDQLARELDGRLERILRKALAEREEDRYGTVAAMAHDLHRWVARSDKPSRADLLVGGLKRRVGRIGKQLGVLS